MKTVLFDMDGTLTLPRKTIDAKMASILIDLTRKARVGIVTGSGLSYIKEQCSKLWDGILRAKLDNLILLPCNGTQFYKFVKGQIMLIEDVSMKDELGEKTYQELIRTILRLQSLAADQLKYLATIPLAGNFISYRGSLLNWCPIGRDSDDIGRECFIQYDNHTKIRKHLMALLASHLENSPFPLRSIEMVLGGSTSIDIYPKGWDKTYALKHVDSTQSFFIGDRCTGTGNDRHIFERINDVGLGAYNVTGPIETIKIIKKIILPKLGEKNE